MLVLLAFLSDGHRYCPLLFFFSLEWGAASFPSPYVFFRARCVFSERFFILFLADAILIWMSLQSNALGILFFSFLVFSRASRIFSRRSLLSLFNGTPPEFNTCIDFFSLYSPRPLPGYRTIVSFLLSLLVRLRALLPR